MIEVRDFSTLSPTNTAAWREIFGQALTEYYPSGDFRRGSLQFFVVRPTAAVAEALAETGRRLLASDSLAAIDADPTLADPAIVDKYLSRWGLTRQEGSRSAGPVLIVLETALPIVISAGAIFRTGGLAFAATGVFAARAEEANVIGPTDRLLRRLADGTYGFTIDVEAVADGAEYRLTRDTLLLPEQSPPQFVRAQVLADFSPGRAIENNAELLARQREGVAARTLSNRVTMGAVLRDLVPTLTAQSVVGFGDAELVRAMHSVLPIAIPGRVDWYVQPEPLYRTTTLTKEATLVETRIDGTGEWQFAIGREELPGFYDVLAIQPTDASGLLGGYPLLSDVRGVDLSGDGFRPDIADAIEGVYSRYQTAVIRFHDPDTVTTALEIGATASYAVACRHAEGILAMQNWVEAEATRYHGGDALVKAAVPCFLQIAFRVDQPITQDEIDVPSLQGELAAFVNTLGFTGQVSAAQIADIASNYFQKPAIIKEIELLGTIRTPAGELVTIFDRDVLTIPERPLEMVTPRTTVFQLPPSGIGIDVRRF